MSLNARARTIATLAAAGMVASALVGMSVGSASAAGQQLFDQPFNNNTSDGDGAVALPGATNAACLTASGNTTSPGLRSCPTAPDAPGSGKLRLTDTATNRIGAVFGAASVPTDQGLDFTFDVYQYGSAAPADGVTFVVSATDPLVPVAPTAVGPAGGSLGYAATGGVAGMPYGYLGFGFDVYGNFSDNAFEGTGCTDPTYMLNRTPGQVVVRGPGNGTVGYCGLNSTAAGAGPAPPVVPLRAATRAASEVPAEVVINPSATSFTTTSGVVVAAKTYKIVFTPVGQAERTLTGALPVVPPGLYPASWLTADGYPKALAFGWIGTTGGSTDFHEVDDTHLASLSGAALPALSISQTAYVKPAPVPGDPVSYIVVVGVEAGAPETFAITVTDTLPPGVVPVAGFGVGWVCQPPSGQVMTCTNSTVPFPSGATLPTLTITAIVTTGTITPAIVQNDSVVTAFSADASAVTGSEPGWQSTGDVPLRVHGPVYSNSTLVTAGGSGISCADTWPLPLGTSGCNGMYVDDQVTVEGACTGRIVTPSAATEDCSTGFHTAAGDDPAIAQPAAYAQPTAGMTLQTLPTCSASSSIVAFTPGLYDNATGLSALTGGAAACRNKTFWFQPGVYYFDFHNSEMPKSGSPIIPYGPDVWTFNDATSVIVGGTKQGWTTSGVTAAALPGACVSPLTSKTAAGVQFVFGDDSRFYQQAGSVELCGSYSATNPPIAFSGSTGLGGGAAQSATLRPSVISATSVPAAAPRFTPVSSVGPIVSETDANAGPAVTNLPANSSATLRISSFSGLATALPDRTVLDAATVTVRHGERGLAAGSTLKVILTSSRAGAVPIVRDLPLTYGGAALTWSTQTVDLLAELGPEIYAFGGDDPYTLDVVLTTSTTAQTATQQLDFVRMNVTWRPTAVRVQSGCVTAFAGCSVLLTSANGGLMNELYVQGTVYLPKAKITVAVRAADGPMFADGLVARSFLLQSDAYTAGVVYDGMLIQVPDYRQGATPLTVYLTAWTCSTGPCTQPPSVAGGWKAVGRTTVEYVDLATGVVAGQRDVSVKSWQLAR